MKAVQISWIMFSIFVCLSLSIFAQENATSNKPIPKLPKDAEHSPDKVSRARPDLEVSDQTGAVVAKLPKPANSNLGNANRDIVRRNLIDEHLFAAMRRDKIPHALMADDYTFLRRVHIDLTGRIPTPEQIATFVSDTDANKRDREIDRLVASDAWVDKWAYWYGDLFRNCANRIGNPATENLDKWIRQSLRDDKPYNQMVTELLTATASGSVWMPDAAPSGYLARLHIPGDTMYSDRHEDTADEIAVQSSKFFLGINFQCISCHGGAGFLEKVDLGLSKKKREDLWAMAAFFGKTRVRIVPFQDRFTISEDGTGYDCKSASSVRLHRNGEAVQPTFMLSGETADQDRPLRSQFAKLLTSHPQFAKATANLFWKEFFGIGIVEPVDGFDLARQDPANPPPAPWTIQPTNPQLLEDLGKYFRDNGFSLRSLMRVMTQSSAYQLSSHFDEEWQASYAPYFSRHFVRLLSSEELHDAIVEATGVYADYPRKHMLYGTPQPAIRYWTQAASPENIGDGDAKQLLRTFGQTNREWANPAKDGSILQAMMMMNSKFVTSRVTTLRESFSKTLFDSTLADDQIVEAMYLRSLSRKPTDQELGIARLWIAEDRKVGIEDLQWSLLNKLDFLFNY
ncbi:MAG: DUF1549 domain-containing protein [Pirellula sp.]